MRGKKARPRPDRPQFQTKWNRTFGRVPPLRDRSTHFDAAENNLACPTYTWANCPHPQVISLVEGNEASKPIRVSILYWYQGVCMAAWSIGGF